MNKTTQLQSTDEANPAESSETQIQENAPLAAKLNRLSDEQIEKLNEDRNVEEIAVPPVDWQRLTLTLKGVEQRPNEDNPIENVTKECNVPFPMSSFVQFENEVRDSLGLPTNSGNLEQDCPYVYDFMQAFEVACNENSCEYKTNWAYKFQGLKNFIFFAYPHGLQSLKELDDRSELWVAYKEHCKSFTKPNGKELSSRTRTSRYLSFISVLIDAEVLIEIYKRSYPQSATENLSKALSVANFSDRDKKYRTLHNHAKTMVMKQLEIWREIKNIVAEGKVQKGFFSSPSSPAKGRTHDSIKRVMGRKNRQKLLDACLEKGEQLFDQGCISYRPSEPDIQKILLDSNNTNHPLIDWLHRANVVGGFNLIMKTKQGGLAKKRTRIRAYNLFDGHLPWVRSTEADAICTFAAYIRSEGHIHLNRLNSETSQVAMTLKNGREILYPSAKDLLPIYVLINLETGWNLDTIAHLPFDLDDCLKVVNGSDNTRTYQIRSFKNRATGVPQTAYVQVQNHKEDTSLNLPRILREYRDYLLFINELSPLPQLASEGAKLLHFFPFNGERNFLGTFKLSDSSDLIQASGKTNKIIHDTTLFPKLKEEKYTFTDGRHLYAEHKYELNNRNINAVRAELGHNQYLMTYLQNEVFVREGQMQVADFQSVILNFLKLKERVDPTRLTIGFRVKDSGRKTILLAKLKDYRASHGLSCSSKYTPPKRPKETCQTGRCTLCENARIGSNSWKGLSKRLGEIMWLQIGSRLGQQVLEKRQVYEEQDALLATLMHPKYEKHIPEMVEIWKATIEKLQSDYQANNLNVDLLLD